MNSHQFKVGERIAVYGSVREKDKIYFSRGSKGTIQESLFAPDELQVKIDDTDKTVLVGSIITCHPKQLRRLKPKKKAKQWSGEWMCPETAFRDSRAVVFVPNSLNGNETGRASLREVIGLEET